MNFAYDIPSLFFNRPPRDRSLTHCSRPPLPPNTHTRACVQAHTHHSIDSTKKSYTAKLGWAALWTWPFLKPNLVFAFSTLGVYCFLFLPFPLLPSHHVTSRLYILVVASIPYCSTAYNPLGCPLSLSLLLSYFRVVVELVIKKKKTQKRGFRTSIDWVCVVYSTQLLVQCSQRRRNDVTPGPLNCCQRHVYREHRINCEDTPHDQKTLRLQCIQLHIYIYIIYLPLFSSRVASAKGFPTKTLSLTDANAVPSILPTPRDLFVRVHTRCFRNSISFSQRVYARAYIYIYIYL